MKFENLVITSKNNAITANVIKYTLGQNPVKSAADDSYSINVIDTDVTNIPVEGKFSLVPQFIDVLMCNWVAPGEGTYGGNIGIVHVAGEHCTNPAHLFTISLQIGGNSNSTGSSGGFNIPQGGNGYGNQNNGGGQSNNWGNLNGQPTGPGGVSANNNSNSNNNTTTPQEPFITTPVLVENALIEKPCVQLQTLGAKPIANSSPPKTVLTNLQDLKTSNASSTKEQMYAMQPTTDDETEFTEHYYPGADNGDEVNANFGNQVISLVVHTHWDANNQLSTFSIGDMYQIYKSILDGNIAFPKTFTAMVITAQGTQYALKITNKDAFVAWGTNYFNQWDNPNQFIRSQFVDPKQDSFYNDNEIKLGNTPAIIAANEKGLASFIGSQNLGLDLYRGDATFSNWTKLSTNLFGTFKETPCN